MDLISFDLSSNSTKPADVQTAPPSETPKTPESSLSNPALSISPIAQVNNISSHKLSSSSCQSTSDLDCLLKNLQTSSNAHAKILLRKQAMERDTKCTHDELFSFPVERRTLTGHCFCGSPLSYTFTFTVSVYNEERAETLRDQFQALFHYNIGPVLDSLVNETIAEIHLSFYIHKQISEILTQERTDSETSSSIITDSTSTSTPYHKLKLLIDTLFNALQTSSSNSNLNNIVDNEERMVMSYHSTSNIRSAILFAGSKIVQEHQPSVISSSSPSPLPTLHRPTVKRSNVTDLLDLAALDKALSLRASFSSVPTSSVESFSLPSSTTNSLFSAKREQEFQSYILQKLLQEPDSSWGKCLVQPTVESLRGGIWITEMIEASLRPGRDSTSLLEQVPWVEFLANCTVEEAKSQVLEPIRRAIDIFATNFQIRQLHILCKVLLVSLTKEVPVVLIVNAYSFLLKILSHQVPALCVDCLFVMTRSRWPTKMVSAPLMVFYPWQLHTKEELTTIFGEVYHLFGRRLQEYDSLLENQRQTHRLGYAGYLIANQHILSEVYSINKAISSSKFLSVTIHHPDGSITTEASRFPQLLILRQIIGQHSRFGEEEHGPFYTMTKLFFDELFFFAFLAPSEALIFTAISSSTVSLSPSTPSVAPTTWASVLKRESIQIIISLCLDTPWLMGCLLFEIGQHLPSISPTQLLPLLKPDLFSRWSIDSHSLNWLAYFLASRAPPPPNHLKSDDGKAMDLFITTFLFAQSQVQFSSQVQSNASAIGSRIFELVEWERMKPTLKMKALLILLASKHSVSQDWLYDRLLGKTGRALTTGPFDKLFLQKVLRIDSELTQYREELVIAQILLAVGLVEDNYKLWHGTPRIFSLGDSGVVNVNRPEGASLSGKANLEGGEWLKRWGFYDRLRYLLRTRNIKALSRVFARVSELLLSSPNVSETEGTVVFTNFRESLIEAVSNDSTATALLHAMIQTTTNASSEEKKAQWINLWLSFLGPGVPSVVTSNMILNVYFQALFLRRISVQPVIDYFYSKNFKKEDSLTLHHVGCYWLSYLVALSIPFSPSVESLRRQLNNTSSVGIPGWNNQSLLSFGIQLAPISSHPILETLCELALTTSDSILALLYWHKFFRIYFDFRRRILEMGVVSNLESTDRVIFGASTILRDSMTNRFLALASDFESKDAIVFKLFGACAVWDESIIFGESSHYFFSDHVFNLFASLHMLSSNITALDEAPVSSVSTSLDLNGDVVSMSLAQVLPGVRDIDYIFFTRDSLSSSVAGHIEQISLVYDAIFHLLQQGESRTQVISRDFVEVFSQLEHLADSLRKEDEEYLQLLKQANTNIAIPLRGNGLCPNRCEPPSVLQGMATKIGPGTPTNKDDIKRNRMMFNSDYLALFEVGRSLARFLVVLERMVFDYQQEHDCMQELFYGLLPVLLQEVLPQDSSLIKRLSDLLMQIGRMVVTSDDEQERLLHAILSHSTRKHSPDEEELQTSASFSTSSISASCSTSSFSSINRIEPLVTLFRPFEVLVDRKHREDRRDHLAVYLQLLRYFMTNSGVLYPSEEALLCSAFRFDLFTKTILQSYSGVASQDSLETFSKEFLQLLPVTLSKREFSSLTEALFLFFIERSITAQDRLLHDDTTTAICMLLQLSVEDRCSTGWDLCWSSAFNRLPFKDSNVPLSILQLFSSQLKATVSLPLHQLLAIVSVVKSIIHTLSLVEAISEESGIFRIQGRNDTSVVLSEIEGFISLVLRLAALSPSHPLPSSLTSSTSPRTSLVITSPSSVLDVLSSIVDLLHSITIDCTTTIDWIWSLFVSLLSPSLVSLGTSFDCLESTFSILRFLISDLPWSMAEFHVRFPEQTLSSMSEMLVKSPGTAEVAQAVFSLLDWFSFGDSLLASRTGEVGTGSRLDSYSLIAGSFLQLVLDVNLQRPESVPKQLMEVFSGDPLSSSTPSHKLIRWDLTAPETFRNVSLLRLVKTGALRTEPSKRLIENLLLLRNATLESGAPQSFSYCIAEASALLFTVLSPSRSVVIEEREAIASGTKFASPPSSPPPPNRSTLTSSSSTLWYIPFRDHISIITTLFIPLASYSSLPLSTLSLVTTAILESLVPKWKTTQASSSASLQWFHSTLLSSFHSSRSDTSDSDSPSSSQVSQFKGHPTTHPDYESFTENVYSIVMQFIEGSTPQASLSILNVASSALAEPGAPNGVSNLFIVVIEEALHAYYLREDQASNCLRTAANQLKLAHPNAVIAKCHSMQATLTLQAVLEQQYSFANSLSSVEWMNFAIGWVELITNFKPTHHHRELDLFALWSFLLSLISDDRWLIDMGSEKFSLFHKQLQSFGWPGGITTSLFTRLTSVVSKPKPARNSSSDSSLSASSASSPSASSTFGVSSSSSIGMTSSSSASYSSLAAVTSVTTSTSSSSSSPSTSSASSYSPRMQLVARATLVYSQRLINEKLMKSSSSSSSFSVKTRGGGGSSGSLTDLAQVQKSLVESHEQLTSSSARNDEGFKSFSSFFKEAENYLNPTYDLNQFEMGILRTVATSSQAYLTKCLKTYSSSSSSSASTASSATSASASFGHSTESPTTVHPISGPTLLI